MGRTCLLLCLLLLSTRAGAPPPARPFPAELYPATSLPVGGHITAYGDFPVDATTTAIAAMVNGAARVVTPTVRGCCALLLDVGAVSVGDNVQLTFTGPGNDVQASYVVVAPDSVAPPTLAAIPAVDGVAIVARFLPPVSVADGGGAEARVQLAMEDGEATAFIALDDTGGLLTMAPPRAPFTVPLPAAAPSSRVCFWVRAVDALDRFDEAELCADIPSPVPPEAQPPADDAPSCGATTSGVGLAVPLLVVACVVARRGRRRTAPCALALLAGCPWPDPSTPPEPKVSVCDDDFDDHAWTASHLDDDRFAAWAHEHYGHQAVKLLVVWPAEPDRREVLVNDGAFYGVHDEWFFFRALNGAPVCGAEVSPVDAGPFATVADVYAWAQDQTTLPGFVSWHGERLVADEFYRLARQITPRIYAPLFLLEDSTAPGDYVFVFSSNDPVAVLDVEQALDALDAIAADIVVRWAPAGPGHEVVALELGGSDSRHQHRISAARPFG